MHTFILAVISFFVLSDAMAEEATKTIPYRAERFSCEPERLFEGDTLTVRISVPHPLEMIMWDPDNTMYYIREPLKITRNPATKPPRGRQ